MLCGWAQIVHLKICLTFTFYFYVRMCVFCLYICIGTKCMSDAHGGQIGY